MTLASVQTTYGALIIKGMQRMLWAHAYGAWAEQDLGTRDPDAADLLASSTRPHSGGVSLAWLDVAPPTPGAARSAARDLAKLIATSEEMPADEHPLALLYAMVMEIDTGEPFSWESPEEPQPLRRQQPILFLDSSRGHNIPRDFVEGLVEGALIDADPDDVEILRRGDTQENESYWDAWDSLMNSAHVKDKEGVIYSITLGGDGDVFLIPEGMEWSDKEDWYVWPDEPEVVHLAEQFGRDLAHMALRDGISWFDDHKQTNGNMEWVPAIPAFVVDYDGEMLTWSSFKTMVDADKLTASEAARLGIGSESVERRVRITFDEVTPGATDEDEPTVESGWEDEEGVVINEDEDEGEDYVFGTVRFLQQYGANEASSNSFHPGVWYTQIDGRTNYQTGAVRTLSFHLYGYTPEEEAQVFEEMVPPRRQWRARP